MTKLQAPASKSATKVTGRKVVPPKPLWTPASGITYSALSTFLECREQFRLGYVEGWSPKESSDAIEFGSIFHNFCEHFDFQQPHSSAVEQIDKCITNLLKTRRSNHKTVSNEYSHLLQLAKTTFLGYIKAQPNDHLQWIAREENFSCPITVPRRHWIRQVGTHREVVSLQNNGGAGDRDTGYRTINLRGKRDGIFVYPERPNELWVFETKTKSRIDEEGLLASLGFNMQAMLYAYVTREQYKSKVVQDNRTPKQGGVLPRGEIVPAVVKGILYNVIRRPGQKLKVGEPLAAFFGRVAAEIEKDPDHYFKRQVITLQPNDLDDWATTVLFPILNQLLDWWESVSATPSTPFNPQSDLHYFNPNALFNTYGRCHLFNLITSGNKFMYKKRRHVFPELEE